MWTAKLDINSFYILASLHHKNVLNCSQNDILITGYDFSLY